MEDSQKSSEIREPTWRPTRTMGRYTHAVYGGEDWRENLSAALSSPHSLFCLAPLALLQHLGRGVRLLYGPWSWRSTIETLESTTFIGFPKAIIIPWLLKMLMLPRGWQAITLHCQWHYDIDICALREISSNIGCNGSKFGSDIPDAQRMNLLF